jgi:hypothetical protein
MGRVVRAVVLGSTMIATGATARTRSVPPRIELDGCVMPAAACPAPRDVVKLRAGERSFEFAVDEIRFPTSGASPSKVLTELKLRHFAVHGPKELVDRLTTGVHVRIRGALRLSSQYLIINAVESLPQE